ncbi:2-oxoglutarate and iron-dependent oxygenase domain-containing protein [Streptomyces sp. G-G2]|uniref:isopenicillin N synthase family dioxygenase n=1 Tax=Streptomyces sp. G-G2 TaxID=3046201 RepID=UPI0024B9681D|nr:2-oxoglutarate and iron-dependent oxygenase domain-containing protein [Streptomyces sp. G-G2]MDJ0382742.1 2-oxoglutarate and iron-dependent oxygenase domain-containing protein [Streptomyces sp. G-G2]
MTRSPVPVIDLRPWRSGGPGARARTAARVDRALQEAGFLLITGHGVDPVLPARIREAARSFFRLPAGAKAPYAVPVGGRGWLGPGAEANSCAEGAASPPDLKESWSCAAEDPTGDPEVDAEWFRPNTWPAEVPALRPPVTEYLARMRALSDELLELLAVALGAEEDLFTRHTGHPTWGFNVNWYPGTDRVGPPLPGQFRIGAHTDFGTVTVLDREPGAGGLQVHTDSGGWQDAPWDPAALTVNIGDLMARWTGDRWRAGRHRVMPPPAEAPAEELLSLVYFYECDAHTRVESLPAPTGRVVHGPVDSHLYLRAKLDAITVTP